jgi:hypothetical protein
MIVVLVYGAEKSSDVLFCTANSVNHRVLIVSNYQIINV